MFSPANPDTACGMWSLTYIISLCIVITLITVGLILSKKFDEQKIRKVLIFDALFSSVTEIIKMMFYAVTYGISEIEILPLYFCSLFIYMSIFTCLRNKTLKETGLSFLFFGGIIGATAFFIHPSACIPNYPIYHFMCIRTMMFHGLMIYTGLLLVITGYFKPSLKYFKHYVISLGIICILAYICNLIFDKDYMYIQKPLDIQLSIDIYNKIPNIYPFVVMILEILVPFFVSYGLYQLIVYCQKKLTKCKE